MNVRGGWLMQKRYRFKKVLQNILTAISVLTLTLSQRGLRPSFLFICEKDDGLGVARCLNLLFIVIY